MSRTANWKQPCGKAGTNVPLGEDKEAPPCPDLRVRDSILEFSDVEWCTQWSHPHGLSSWRRGACMSWALSGDGTQRGGLHLLLSPPPAWAKAGRVPASEVSLGSQHFSSHGLHELVQGGQGA